MIKKKRKEKKEERDLNISKDVMLRSIVIKENSNTFLLVCLTIFM